MSRIVEEYNGMKPTIDHTSFGSITIEGEKYEHDVLIRCSGDIKKRKKKLSKQVYGTSHMVSKEEAEHVFEDGLEILVVGTGQNGALQLSQEAEKFFRENGVTVILQRTPQAIEAFNKRKGNVAGLFHLTC